MKKICLTVVGLYIMFLHAFSQKTVPDSIYTIKPLKIEEINLVSSYYSQNGDHSAVTGGVGTEKVTDISNGLDVKLVSSDMYNRKNTFILGLGLDHHTSASAAYVSKTGASKTGGSRVYPSASWSVENPAKKTEFGIGAYYSGEYNYQSFGLDLNYSKKTNKNGEFSTKLTGYFDRVKEIYPSELRPAPVIITSASGRDSKSAIPSLPRTTLTGSFSFTQIFNSRLQGSLLTDIVYQSGYLGLPFHRVYFNTGTDAVEALPSQRIKFPIGARLNYFIGDNFIVKTYYRFYIDDWGLKSHTANIELPIKFTPFFSLSPFYRYYVQTAVKYFAPYEQHKETDQFYTSNYALSAFSSQFFGIGLRTAPPKGVFGTHISALELRVGHYLQTTDLVSNVISMNLTFK